MQTNQTQADLRRGINGEATSIDTGNLTTESGSTIAHFYVQVLKELCLLRSLKGYTAVPSVFTPPSRVGEINSSGVEQAVWLDEYAKYVS